MAKPIIDIVTPSIPCEADIIEQSKAFIETLGFTPRYTLDTDTPKTAIGFYPEPVRLAHLEEALHAEDSSIIWALRGGYGLTPLAPEILKFESPKQSKLLIGFSDVTALHIIATQCWNWETIHGPVLFQAASGLIHEDVIAEIKSLCCGNLIQTTIPLIALNKHASTSNQISAPITGGNLAIIQTSLGTDWQIDCQDKMLFIEEVNEAGYRIDRSLHHAYQAGVFNGCKALLVGDIDKSADKNGEDIAPYVIDLWAQRLGIPVLRMSGYGHGPRNGLIPFNKTCTLQLGEQPTLECHY